MTSPRRRTSLATRIGIGFVAGALAGLAANRIWGGEALRGVVDGLTYPLGNVFLRLLFLLVVPLIVTALSLGVSELGDLRRVGRVGLRTLGYTLIVSSISVAIGVGLTNLVKPGAGTTPEERAEIQAMLAASGTSLGSATKVEPVTVMKIVNDVIPRNPVEAMAGAFQGHMLGVMFFALFMGLGITLVPAERTKTLVGALRGLHEVLFRLVEVVMRLAPIGVAALIFSLLARFGFDMVVKVAAYVGTVLLGLAIHQFGVYSLLLKVLVGVSPRRFFSAIREVMVTAFSTASSNATLPTALRVAEEKLGVAREVGGFVLTVGSTANQNGTALFEGVTVLFLAQFYGVDLTLGQQVQVVVMSILAGVGTAGVPGGSLPLIVLLLISVGIPPEGIGVILGVNHILDMSRTVPNVTGDLTAAVYVAKKEGVLGPQLTAAAPRA